jgi:hypothetical protein
MRLVGFVAALAAWALLLTYGLLAVTMGGCTAADPGCDPSHAGGLAIVGLIGLSSFAAIVWWFLIRPAKS